MANKPSSRTNRVRPPEGLNLTPFIDMITCLMFFLMMFAGIIPVVMIDAPLPKTAATAEEVRKAKNDKNKLELTVNLSPEAIVVRSAFGGTRSFQKAGEAFPWKEIHQFFVELHGKNQDAKELTLMPSDDTIYDAMVQVMDAARELAPGDPGYQSVPPEIQSQPESAEYNRMFSEVSIGGV